MQNQMTQMQHKHQEEFQLVLTTQATAAQDSAAFHVKCLADSMEQFDYDPENNLTFEAYYRRYESVLTTHSKGLDEPTKVHLLLQKFPQAQYERYADSILSESPQDRTLSSTVESFKLLFGHKETKSAMRHMSFNLVKQEGENFSEYAGRINKHAEKFDVGKCTADDFKVLLFVSGLKSPDDLSVLERLLTKVDNQHLEMEKAKDENARSLIHNLKLQDLVNEAERSNCLRKDKCKVVESASVQVQAIQKQRFANKDKSPTYSTRQAKKFPPSPCPACGASHWKHDCPYKEKDCGECSLKGHKTGFCDNKELHEAKH